jgi:hypothetical protein
MNTHLGRHGRLITRPRQFRLGLTTIALVGAGLVLAGCPGPIGLKVEKVEVGDPTVRVKCTGGFQADVPLTITREAAPAAPARSYPLPTKGDAKTSNFNNVTTVLDRTYGNASPNDAVAFSGTLTDTCQPGSFLATFTAKEGPVPTPASKTIDVPALGYSLPGGIPQTNGNPSAFVAKFKIKNCAAAARAFTVKAIAANNTVPDPTVAPRMPLNIPGGGTKEITISGSKKDEHAGATYVVRVTAPPAMACSDQGEVE